MSNLFGNRIYSIFSASFLAVLLLLAPCKVRNSIEIALGIQQTVSLNKAKSVSSQLCCSTKPKIAMVQNTHIAQKSSNQDFSILVVSTSFEGFDLTPQITTFSEFNLFQSSAIQEIPLYILLRNFKVYLF